VKLNHNDELEKRINDLETAKGAEMTITALDKRLRHIERKLPELPCPVPEHNRALILIENQSTENKQQDSPR
jgi:hypothetical protein